MAIVTSTPTASSLTVNGTARAEGLISWSIPNVPAGTKISSCLLTGVATATMTSGNATITVNDQAVTSGEQFSISLGDGNDVSSVTVIATGDVDGAAGTIEFSNLLYTVVYLESFTVRFFDSDGTLLKEEKVIEGNNSNPPAPPNKDGVVFVGWTGDHKNITSNIDLTAKYEAFVAPISQELTVSASNVSIKTGRLSTSSSGTISWTNTGLPDGASVSKITITGTCTVSNATSITQVKVGDTVVALSTSGASFTADANPTSLTSASVAISHASEIDSAFSTLLQILTIFYAFTFNFCIFTQK